MFTQSQEKDNNWISNWWPWIRGTITSKKTLGLLTLGLLTGGSRLALLGRQVERSNMETGDLVPRGEINGALSRRILNFVDASAKMQQIDPRQQAADAIDLPYLEKMSESEEFKSYLAELGIGAKDKAKENSEFEQTEDKVEQLEPRTNTGIINYQPVGDPVLVATGGTDVDIACSNSADTCLVTWYSGDSYMHTQQFNVNNFTIGKESVFNSAGPRYQITHLSNGGYALARVSSATWHLRGNLFTSEGVDIKNIDLLTSYCTPSIASYSYGVFVEHCRYSSEYYRQAKLVENGGTVGETIFIETAPKLRSTVSARGNIVIDIFYRSNLIGKFVHMDTKIVSGGYTVPLDPQIAIGEYQSVAFGNMDEFLVATDGIEGSESKIYVLSGKTNSTFFNNCNYKGPYIMPGINMGPVETTYIGHDSEDRSLYDVTFRDISSNSVGTRCWYDESISQPQCSPPETITSIPNVRKSSTAVTQDGELVRGFWTSDDKIWLQKYTCSPVPCAKTPEDVPSHPSGWSNSDQKLSEKSASTTDPNGGSKVGIIIGSLLGVGGCFGVVGSGAAYFWRRRKGNKRNKAFQLNELKVANRKSLGNSEKIEAVSGTIDPHSLTDFEVIGRGASGTVYKVKYLGGDAAVKQLSIAEADSEALNLFAQEAELMKELRHPHIVQFYGYYQSQTKYNILMEYVSGGELSKVLYDTQTAFPWYPNRWDIAHDVASAVSYLHNNPVIRIIHRDLKSQNVLVHYEYEGNCMRIRAKVADVGIAKVMSEKEEMPTMTKAIGTPFWMAPEVVKAQGEGKKITYNEKVDTYSYGIIMSELINRKPPFSEIENHFKVVPLVLDGGRPEVNRKQAPTSFVALMERCWAQRAADRPEMKEVVNTLDQMQQEVQSFTC